MLAEVNSYYIRRLTQWLSFTRLDRLKLQFSSSHVKFDVWAGRNERLIKAGAYGLLIVVNLYRAVAIKYSNGPYKH